MSNRPVAVLLADILEAIERIELYTQGLGFNMFEQDRKTVDAVVRNCEIIGESANRLPTSFKEADKTIPWEQLVGLRNRIVHEYFGVDVAIIWQVVAHDIPLLKDGITHLLSQTT